MYFDDEKNQIEYLMRTVSLGNHLLISNNAFEKKISKLISHFDELKNDSGHDKEPPDFYSNDMDIMFDIYRVNDSEVKKSYNPTMIAERKMQQEVEQSRIAEILPQATSNLICIDKDWGSDEIHNISQYIKNIKRVTNEHLSSKAHPNKIQDIWVKKHPIITRKGLVVFDETENYFQGQCVPYQSGQWLFIWDKSKPLTLYKPWMDKNILQPIYESGCDFLIWFMPYKFTHLVQHTKEGYFPIIVIMDTRFPRTDFIEYDYSKFTRT